MRTVKLPEGPPVEPDRAATLLVSEPGRAAAAPREGLTLSGRYQLLNRLGAGGMGEVYRGHHLTLDIPIAIKLMHQDIASAPSYAQRFRQEAQAASRIQHRNVVRVLDFGEDQGLWYLVMEYLEGESLAHSLARELPTLAAARTAMTDVLSALHAAHDLGVVHRDLKPENVLSTHESDGRVVHKVVDFGLAHLEPKGEAAERLTQPDSVAGTPEYMSPEQCESLDVGPATDLYAAGCLLTALLQGTPPFTARSPVEIMARHMFLPPPALARPAGREPIPPALEALRLRLLAKEPADRPATAADTLDLLGRAFDSHATGRSEARAVTRSERAPAWPRQERGPDAEPASKSLPERPAGAAIRWDGEPPPGDVQTGLALAELRLERPGREKAKLRVLSTATVREALLGLARDPGLPCVVVAPIGDAGDVQRLIEAGAADVVPAPASVALLTKKLLRLVRRG